MSGERWRRALALLVSLLIHAQVLSLIFSGQGLGLPGAGIPWRDRRAEVPELRVVLVPTHVAAAEPVGNSVATPSQQASTAQPVAGGPTPTPSPPPAPPPGVMAGAMVAGDRPVELRTQERIAAAAADPAHPPSRVDRRGDVIAPVLPKPAVIDMQPSDAAASVVPAAPSAPASPVPVAPVTSSAENLTSMHRDSGGAAREPVRLAEEQQESQRQDAARQEASRAEAGRLEAARLEAERLETERRVADRVEAQRQEAARAEAARLEAERREVARLEAERREATRLAAERMEAQRLEAARQEAARAEAARLEAARLETERREAARLAAERLEAQRQETARQEAARSEAARLEAERREAALRAIGRQLDEEAARRRETSRTARPPSTLPLSLSTARRVRVWGRVDPNVELIRYVEAWERKIQFNTAVDTVRDLAGRIRTNPVVTVAVRSDGSVESVTFVLSSGVAEVDDAIRSIVQSHEHYQAFPPALAREVDVIEIRRTWYFDMAIRFY